jgi:REP element-mobilizing transposase RayT
MGQSFTCLHYHLIFSTKRRAPQITSEFRQRLYDYIGGILKNANGCLIAAGGADDHVHLLARLHAQTAVADALRIIKTNSSKWVHETLTNKSDFAWQTGYAAFAVSRSNMAAVRRYIETQEAHHRRVTFQEELIVFLEKHGLEYDERFIWE